LINIDFPLQRGDDKRGGCRMDVRCYSRKYLNEKYFAKSPADNL